MYFSGFVRYLEYLLISGHRTGHGIHSPFVFDLVSHVFRNKIDPAIVLKVEKIRRKNLSDERIINVTDLGAGSGKMKDSRRKISDIARYSAVPGRYGRLLSNMAAEFGHPAIIEMGTSLGISTMYLALANQKNTVYTIEGCPETSSVARENFYYAGIGNIKSMTGSFDEIIPRMKKESIIPGLIFIDGDHRKEALLRHFGNVAEFSDEKSVVIIDDIHSSRGMEEAWNEIKLFKNVTLTIDIFRMGFVFFRRGLSRLDYVIRY